MTLPDIVTKQTNLTTLDTNQWPLSDRLIDTNIWYQKIVSMILDSQDEEDFDDQRRTDYPIKTTSLTTGQDYTISTSEKILKFKDLNISYDGVTLYKATPIDSGESRPNIVANADNETILKTIDSQFSKTSPKYDYKYNSIFIYPRASADDVAAGGFMTAEWYRQPLEFTIDNMTDDTIVPGFDDTFHAMLAYGPAYEVCLSKQMPQAKAIYNELQIYEQRLRTQYSSKQLDRRMTLQPNYQNYK